MANTENPSKAATFETNFKATQRKLYGIAYGKLGHPQNAEDVVQTTALNMWQRLQSPGAENLLNEQNFQKYSARVAANEAVSELRHQSVLNKRSISEKGEDMGDDNTQKLESIADVSSNTEEIAVENEMLAISIQALRQLDPKKQEIVLASLRGQSLSEIAQTTGRNLNTLKQVYYRAIENMQAYVRDHYDPDVEVHNVYNRPKKTTSKIEAA